MAKLLTGGLKKTVGKAFSGLFLDATIARDTIEGGVDPWDPATPTTSTYQCKAIHDEYAERLRLEGLVEAGDRKLLILAQGLSIEPKPLDRVTIRGQIFVLINVKTDPAKATWECQGRS